MSFKYIRSKDVSKDHYVNSKLYTLYHNIKARCYNDKHPDYKYYGKTIKCNKESILKVKQLIK